MISRDSSLQPDTRNSFGMSGNDFEDLLEPSEPPAAFFGNSRSFTLAQCEPVSVNTGGLADRANERTLIILQFQLRDSRKFSTWHPPSRAEGAYPQKCMVELPRNHFSEMHFDKFPDPSTFQCWKTSFETEVCSCSNFPTDAMLWIKEVEMVESVDNLEASRSIGGHRFPNFEMLDVKIASSLKKIITNPYLKKRVNLEERKTQMQDPFLRGRQIAYMISQHFRVTGAHEAVLDYTDLRISLHYDGIQDFDARWDHAQRSTSEVLQYSILESLCKMRIRESDHIRTVLAMALL